MLDSMRMADRAWMNVTQKKIKNCFEKACFSSVESESDEEQELHTETHQCEEWEKVSKILKLSKTPTFEKFTEFDSGVQVCGLWTDGRGSFCQDSDVIFCNDADTLFKALGLQHNPQEWRLFIDSSKVSLKAVLLHNGNKPSSIPVKCSRLYERNIRSLEAYVVQY
ncbi:hypothetical protein AVEN_273595-1 [Araneus ventricosus]|uniref:Uncharacterized protein n=1 Tax=Araneus ventricosus TaxID=182803 RepID=A0A4Y2USB4_ARAVE|nr:hypothetical protein AVEN_273595-1 [Araneus ventricosus]